jgi:hypothetical protein
MAAGQEHHSLIRELNDAMRAGGLTSPSHNRWFLTPGVLALGPPTVEMIVEAIRTFSAFTADNDPYGEHDFGSIVVRNQPVFWKIDYYDRGLTEGSPDPANAELTCRVLTIMLSMEY